MQKNTTKKMISRFLAMVMSFALIFVMAPYSLEAHAATGSWILTSESVSICVGYKDSNFESHDVITGDGSSPITSGETISADRTHSITNSYIGKFDGSVRFMEGGGYIWKPEEPETSDNYSDCTIPNSSYAPGETVTLQIHTWTENMAGFGRTSRRVASIGVSNISYTGSKGENLKDANGIGVFNQNSTGNSSFSTGVTGDTTITVSGKMWEDPKDGDTCTIYYTTDAGQYEWNYTYSESGTKPDSSNDKTESNETNIDNPGNDTEISNNVNGYNAITATDNIDRTCEGEWVFDKVESYAGYRADTVVFDTDLNQAMLFNRTDDVTFVAMCGFPGDVIAGGDTAIFPMGMSVQDVSYKEGYRFDNCWLGATAFEIDNPHDLSLFPDGNHIKFINKDNPEDDRCICHGSVWKDPVDEDNYGSELENKTATWRFPYGIKDGESITVWFVDQGTDSKGPALGWRYIWHSTSGLEPMNVGTYNRQVDYNGNKGAWVMKSYELIYPENKRDMKDIAVYQDMKNQKFTMAYLNSSDMVQSWGYFESVFDFPPEIIPDSTKFTINITTNSLGGYAYMGCNRTNLRYGRNMDSLDSPTISIEMWDEEEARYYSSVNTTDEMSKAFGSVTKPFTFDLFRSGPNKAGDELTIIYDAGPVIAFNYVWVE